MNEFDAPRLDALARRLGLAPRQLALAAARLARDEGAADPRRRRTALDAARSPSAAMEHAAALLATPVAGFALDDVERALAVLWPATEPGASDAAARPSGGSESTPFLLPHAGQGTEGG